MFQVSIRPLLRKHFQPGVRAALGLRRGRRFTTDTHDDCAARVALGPIGLPSEDFSYRLKDGVAHLNHGSFGAPPKPVRDVENSLRESWYTYPDRWYFGGQLHRQMEYARECVGTALGVPGSEA